MSNNNMAKKHNYIIILSWSGVIAWMLVIFFLSAQTGTASGQMSKGIARFVAELVEIVVPWVNIDVVHILIRKGAHFTAYLVLGLLVFNAVQSSGWRGRKALWWAVGISILYAVSDETHQLFVPDRGAQVIDVLIDSAGALLGSGVLYRIRRSDKREVASTEATKQQ